MKTTTKFLATMSTASVMLVIGAQTALAQIAQTPGATPVKNNSPLGNLGSKISIAEIIAVLALITVGLIALMYIRNAPRFATDEDGPKVVRADRVVAGQAPRRAVDVSQAVPVLAAPPAIPSSVAPVAPVAVAPVAVAPVAVAPAAPAAAAAAPAVPAPEPAPAPDAASAAPSPPAPAPAARPEVALDQETFEAKLEELLAAGTDRRVAEGQARRAAMIAARKKAEAEGQG